MPDNSLLIKEEILSLLFLSKNVTVRINILSPRGSYCINLS